MKTYEAMFLLDAGNTDFESTSAPIREVLERADAEILSIKPWDERRLAFKIKGRKRALYVLTYFKADPSRIDEMQHDIQLNDRLLRAMILSGDHVSEEQINADTPATIAESRQAEADAELAAKKEAESDEQTTQEETKPDESDESPATPEPTEATETSEVTQTPETETPEAAETPEVSEATETQPSEDAEDTEDTEDTKDTEDADTTDKD